MTQVALAERVGGIADLALAAHKDQDIARAFVAQLVHRVKDGLELIALGVVGVFYHRTVTHFYRVSTARNLDDRRIVEVARKTFRVDGGRSNDHLQIRTTRQQLPQIAQQEVDVQAALVRFIDDDGVVLHQQTVLLNFGQQDPVGH